MPRNTPWCERYLYFIDFYKKAKQYFHFLMMFSQSGI